MKELYEILTAILLLHAGAAIAMLTCYFAGVFKHCEKWEERR